MGDVIAYHLGNLWRRLVLPQRIGNWSLTSLQQRLVKTGGRLIKHARYFCLLLADGHLTRPLFGALLRRIWALPVPTPAEREGDFSALLEVDAKCQIYNPFTRRRLPTGRYEADPFPGNLVPPSMISDTARAILRFYPRPTAPGLAGGRNNLPLPNEPERIHYYTHTARIDHHWSERQRIFVRANVYKRDSKTTTGSTTKPRASSSSSCRGARPSTK